MKRWLLRLSALSGVVVLGLIAIAQAQRSSAPFDSPDGVAPQSQSTGESGRFGPDSTARIISVEDRPAQRVSQTLRPTDDAADSAPPTSKHGTEPNDPFNVRDRSAAALPERSSDVPERFPGAKTVAVLPGDSDSSSDSHSTRSTSSPADSGSVFTAGSRYNNPIRGDVRSAAAAGPAPAFEDRESKAVNPDPAVGPSLSPPANGAKPLPRAEARNAADSDAGTHSGPYAGSAGAADAAATISVMKRGGAPANAFRPPVTDAAPAETVATTEGAGRPGIKQLEGAQSPQLMIEKVAPSEVQVGKPAKFEIKVRNTGSVTAQGVEIHDEIPKGTQLVGTTPAATQGPRGEMVWSLGTLNPGDQVVAQLDLLPITEGEIGSVASVTFRADASARTVATKPQLALQVSGPKQVMIGDDATLTIRLSNPGSGAAGGVVLSERVPAGLRHPAGSELEFEVGTLKPGESRQIELTLNAAQAGRVTNSLMARAEGNLKAEEKAEFDVIAPALAVAMTGPSKRYLERQATYTVSVSNPGTAPAKDVQLVTQLPKGLKFVKANNSGQYDPNTHTVSWSLEELPATESGTVTLVAVPIEVGEQKMKVQGKARQGLSDEKEQTVVVEGLASLAFDVQAADEAIEIGGETTYQIHVVNQGSKAASNVQIAAIFPAELKATRAEGPSRETVEDHRVQFEPLARLSPKADATFRIRAQALQAGDLRVKVQLMTDETRQPITKEGSTRVYSDQ